MKKEPLCGVLDLHNLLGKKWTYGLFYNLSDKPLTFNQLDKMSKREVNPTLLSNRLKKLVGLGLVQREEEGRSIHYSITEKGKELKGILNNIKNLAENLDCFIPENCLGRTCDGCKSFNKAGV